MQTPTEQASLSETHGSVIGSRDTKIVAQIMAGGSGQQASSSLAESSTALRQPEKSIKQTLSAPPTHDDSEVNEAIPEVCATSGSQGHNFPVHPDPVVQRFDWRTFLEIDEIPPELNILNIPFSDFVGMFIGSKAGDSMKVSTQITT
jgi:hypothetical protein